MKPIIGITSCFENNNGRKFTSLSYDYIEAVNKAGGVALILPITIEEKLLDSYINTINGLLFSGGEDLSPLLYGENPIDKVDTICYDRDNYEMNLFKKAYRRQIPILGICRGMQLINVALGGTLYQDINRQIQGSLGHRSQQYIIEQPYHTVKIVRGSKLYEVFEKENIEVNSFHHQSIKDIGEGLWAVAYSHDGVVEAVQSLGADFLLGIQWHPEKLINRYPIFQRVFQMFVNACSL